jgi:hypothetical protein
LRRSHASLVECFGHEEDHVHGVSGLVLCPCLRFRPAGLCLHHGSATALKTVRFALYYQEYTHLYYHVLGHGICRNPPIEEIKQTVEETMGNMKYEQWLALSDDERPRIGHQKL